MGIFSPGVSWAVFLLAIIVAIAFIAFAVEEVARYVRQREQRRMQKHAWQQYNRWLHNTTGQQHHAHNK